MGAGAGFGGVTALLLVQFVPVEFAPGVP